MGLEERDTTPLQRNSLGEVEAFNATQKISFSNMVKEVRGCDTDVTLKSKKSEEVTAPSPFLPSTNVE